MVLSQAGLGDTGAVCTHRGLFSLWSSKAVPLV